MQVIKKYFPELTDVQTSQFQQLQELYNYWNERINVISRKDIDQLYERHVLHSLAIAAFFKLPDGTKVLDVGTGGGFPGIPLAIMFPNIHFTLADSIGKKITVVNEVSNSIGLQNLIAVHTRAESIKEKFNFVVSRAVTEFPPFYNWVKNSFSKESIPWVKNGIIYLKGGDFEKELAKYPKAKVFNIKEKFNEEYFETKKIIYLPMS
jgi:16S rRNA (guanine527-N7)-methyltransferase